MPGTGALDRATLLSLLGVPEGPDGYCIDCGHGLFDADPVLNEHMIECGVAVAEAVASSFESRLKNSDERLVVEAVARFMEPKLLEMLERENDPARQRKVA